MCSRSCFCNSFANIYRNSTDTTLLIISWSSFSVIKYSCIFIMMNDPSLVFKYLSNCSSQMGLYISSYYLRIIICHVRPAAHLFLIPLSCLLKMVRVFILTYTGHRIVSFIHKIVALCCENVLLCPHSFRRECYVLYNRILFLYYRPLQLPPC